MRNVLLLIALLFGGLLSAEPATDITFEINGLPNGWCRIIGMVGDQNYLSDTLLAENGVARLQRETPLSGGLYYFVFPDQRTFVQFLADKDQQFTLKANRQDLIGTLMVEGSEDNRLFAFNQQWERLWRIRYDSTDRALKALPAGDLNQSFLKNKRDQLLQERQDHIESFSVEHPESFFTVFKMAGQNPDLTYPQKPGGGLDTLAQLMAYRGAYFDNVDFGDRRLLHTPVLANKLKNYVEQLTPQRPDSVIKYVSPIVDRSLKDDEMFKFIVNWLAIKYEKPKIMGGEKILVHLVDTYFTDARAFWYEDNPEELKKIRRKVDEMRVSMIGMKGQDLRCRNVNGEYESLYELKAPIKVVYIYSYTCSHCKERTPVLVDLMKEWRAKGVEVFALCNDPEEDKWKAFVEKYQMQDLHNVIDPNYESRYYKKYHIDVTPEAYVLDQNNTIIAKDLHPNQLPPVFEKALRKAGN